MRKNFTMSESQFERLYEACRPTIAIWGSGGAPLGPTPQENANAAWRVLGDEMGFVWDSCEPVPGCDQKTFSAEIKGTTP
jgi:hypothetical protein